MCQPHRVSLVRPAEERDRERLGVLAEQLVRLHHSFDPERFLPGEGIANGYGGWLAREAGRKGAVVLVAEVDGRVVGYCYATLEERNYNELLGPHGKLHDVFVDDTARSHGVGKALVARMLSELDALGAPQIVLSTAVPNEFARALFASFGFRPTMIEMSRRPPTT